METQIARGHLVELTYPDRSAVAISTLFAFPYETESHPNRRTRHFGHSIKKAISIQIFTD